ncbi:M12 family metallo-peptidase [Sinomicrobium kalidii]|uniref:reprolysin-like metallopeptidase n=1 Tax=Sinomicrobium kalidii TaxID=2900738 RepID=UPI001E5E9E79|nr:zinc-dependent metalloprotease family protein [Sinomicrobium kalidii]UGU18321.1 M12 family metallo-peptidase [Sinomicrobium kalidii]
MIKKLLLLAFSLSLLMSYGQTPLWTPANGTDRSSVLPAKRQLPADKLYNLDIKALKKALSDAPLRREISGKSKTVVAFPNAEGKLERFAVVEAPVLHPELGARYPGIKSYAGQGIDDPSAIVRFSISHLGLSSMKLSSHQGSIFIEPYSKDRSVYTVYDRKEARHMSAFECTLKEDVLKATTGKSSARNADDGILRTYRLAISATGEYTQYFGGTKIDALAAMNTTMTRVNSIFENDFAITMVLIANTDDVIYTDPASDPYSSGGYNSQLQNTLTTVIGEENYDIGHLFIQGSNNGNAGCIGCVCVDNQKGSGFTSHSIPEGDNFDVDFVAHEMGHQFGANHTFTIRNEGTDAHFEPGSGSTIMGYAGITGSTDVQEHSDPYFHAFSIEQVTNYIKTTACQTDTPTGNNIPTANAGPDYTIPKGTPFALSGEGTDADSEDVLTYCWEQMDEDDALDPFPSPTATSGPVFRSVMPSVSEIRYFPAASTVLEGSTASQWEVVPEVARELNFRLTVRDNRAGGAANNSDDMLITVADEAGPFTITSHQDPSNVATGSTQTVTWDVAGTNSGDINVQKVDILLATSDDFSQLIPLASNTDNDGSEDVTFPEDIDTDHGRIVIKAVDNIFFAVSKSDLSFREFGIYFETKDFIACKPDDLEFTFTYQAASEFAQEVSFSATDVPEDAEIKFDPATANANNTEIHVTLSGIDSLDTGSYTFNIIAEGNELTAEVPLNMSVHNFTDFSSIALVSPLNASNKNDLNTKLEWEPQDDVQTYVIEIATDEEFTSIIEEGTPASAGYVPQNLEYGAAYYWRVKPVSYCNEGEYSDTFFFYTLSQAPVCDEYENNTPVIIDGSQASTVTSTINITDRGLINDISLGLDITHTWVSDLTIDLTSPSGTTVRIINGICGSNQNINAVFSDEGNPITCGNDPAISGTVLPAESLKSLLDEPVTGKWTLTVQDGYDADGGSINAFSLNLCIKPDPLLSPDNFTLKTTSETCRDNQDGMISVEAKEILDYRAVLTGDNGTEVTETFRYFWEATGLDAGNYNMCITVEGYPDFEQCFDVTINQPEELAVSSTVNKAGNSIDLELRGGDLYTIALNGKTVQTSERHISLDLESGDNALTVKTNKDCQGTYKESIYVAPDDVVIYPNPFYDTTRAFIGNAVKGDVQISVFNITGKLVSSLHLDRNGKRNEVELKMSGLPPGIYLVKIQGENFRKTFKLVKL